MRQNETFLRVRYKDTDQMGVVYYANYFIWFEIGRSELMRSLGLTYKQLEQNGILLPVIEAYCKYKNPARYDDQLRIVTTLMFLREVKMGFRYEIFHKEKDLLLVHGETTHAFVSKAGKPAVLRKQNPFLWKILRDALPET
ncbi:MAG TPA: acyl-CoA thioesterase [Firmicutes bacterium]|nr:acyl-CoA thioesterase [Bacillota bacterium]